MYIEIEQFRRNMATCEYKDYGAHCTGGGGDNYELWRCHSLGQSLIKKGESILLS